MKNTWALILSASIFLLGCSQNSTQPPEAGSDFKDLSFAIALPCQNKLSPEITNAYVFISGKDFDTIISELAVSPCTLSGTVNNIPVGKNRHIELKIFDRNNQLCYYGDSKANIELGITTQVTIRLKSQTGNVTIIGVIDDCNTDTTHYTDTTSHLQSMTGCWKITQSNNEWGTIELTQTGDSLAGYSRFETHSDGPISGIVFGDSVRFRITYPTGQGYGDYYGKIMNDSTIEGWGRGSNGATATWKILKGRCDETVDTLNVAGCWKITQSNNEWGILVLTQTGDGLAGYSRFETHSDGPISGIVFGDSVRFRITYPTGQGYGDYYGKLMNDSTIEGWGRGSNGATATWKIVKGNCNDTVSFTSSCWDITQSNKHIGKLQFTLIGDSLTGISHFSTHSNGPVSGKFVGDSLIFRITYPAGDGYGDYYGKMGIYGETIEGWGRGSDGQSASWSAKKTECD